jgi:uncharacterized membrane protein YhhN
MSYTFFLIALAVAALDWIAVAKQQKILGYLTKPGVMVVLLVWLWQAGGLSGGLIWFTIGVLFSMAGDIFLMLPEERFIAGLISFMLAHVSYLVGFTTQAPPINAASVALALSVAIVGIQVYRRIAQGLEKAGRNKLKVPVLAYSAIISLMLLSALTTLVRGDDQWSAGPALAASSGALLFYLSDTLLAWNKFVSPISYGRLRVRIAYHLGQSLIVLGAVLHFSPLA